MLKKIQDAFLGEAEKRIANPFIGAFIIAWVFWNWDFIYAFFFLDQQYVSLKYVGNGDFFTKVEYLKTYGLYNYYDFLWNPFWSGLLVYIGIEWGVTLINICVEWVKNKILKIETVTSEEYEKIKEKIVSISKERSEEKSQYIEENLKLTDALSEANNKIAEKAEEIAKREIEKKDKELKRLMNDIDNRDKRYKQIFEEKEQIEKIANDLAEKNYNLDSIINDKNQEITLLKQNKNHLEKELFKQKNDNNDKKISNNNFKKDYDDFKKTKYFNYFKSLIEDIDNIYTRSLEKFDVMSKKYFETKGIIQIIEDFDYNGNPYYILTDKGNKFLEYYLDENYVDIGDIPF